ncbi:UvrD-helicase domain-containing protein [Paucibacter sp. B2R-40]|uniref:UvrD-helicase domain-containing protein n=1 Tax=Paucibacter sp. B2R-40 TaxID=2893554 RepID=UPI0021E3C635|nr:UvrD-helicase domain-containing protein [Paucibacter sp. B2R-40]MCV2356552.1 UvrD-helicase domain-containing protein [Paucibacter sp. B2R-40]
MKNKIRFISAGAGSGKTFTLADLLHKELTAKRISPAGVLATTFTNKAAAELRERVTSHLVEKRAFALANQMGQARIGTVNSVCGELLQRFAFEAGMATEQTVLDEARATQLLREAIDTVIEAADLHSLLHVAQRLSLRDDPQGGAPPWRSALRALIDQARSNAIGASELSALGPSNAEQMLAHLPKVSSADLDAKLAREIKQVLPELRKASEASGKKNTATYLKLLEDLTQSSSVVDMSWADWARLSKAEPEKSLIPLTQSVADSAGQYLSHERLRSDVHEYLSRMFDLAAKTLGVYERYKDELGVVDFTDQERRLLTVLNHPVVAETLSEELELLLVDEFQDTSPIQLALFLKLAQYAKQVVWVGDIKQAIYGFRGSDADLMRAVIDELPALNGSKEVLPKSWRSRPPLVHFVNHLFGTAFAGIPKTEVTLQPTRADIDGTAVADWILEGGNQEAQYLALCAGIAELVAEGRQILDRETLQLRPIRWSDIAVLSRSNDKVQRIASTLQQHGVPSATEQPGLLSTPECVLFMACLRRFNDRGDTIATAEILSLADCLEPEEWLADRLRWLENSGKPTQWIEGQEGAGHAHEILKVLVQLRELALVLTPREVVELILQRCQIARLVLQWQQQSDIARQRLANLDQLLGLTSQYEDECRSSHGVATISGLLLWLLDKQSQLQDACAQPGVDAVHILTHHRAKGLEWPVVILCDLNADVRDRLWNSVQASTLGDFEVHDPLGNRYLRYWPWPFGAQKKVAFADDMAQTEIGKRLREAAVNEEKRLLYVSMTRARDLLILARSAKKLDGEWMQAINLNGLLPEGDATCIALEKKLSIPFERKQLSAANLKNPPKPNAQVLRWFAMGTSALSRPALFESPSGAKDVAGKVLETIKVGQRIATKQVTDRGTFGDAVHACLAAHMADAKAPLNGQEVIAMLARTGQSHVVDGAELHSQAEAIREWVFSRWPDAKAWVELPMSQAQANGQLLSGRADLVLDTEAGLILIDHKSTPAGTAQHASLAEAHCGQLRAYAAVLESTTGRKVSESWLVLPVSGAAIRLA